MNGEGPSVPITTLAGIQSLTELLLELPVPAPLPGATGCSNRSLLAHPQEAQEAQRLLAAPPDNFLIPQLLEVLGHTSLLDQVEVKDGFCGRTAHTGQTSALLQCIVNRHPGLFHGLAHIPAVGPATPASTPVVPAPNSNQSQWMQSQFSPNTIYSQPASFNASHLSSPQSNASPQFPAQESPSYFPQQESHPPNPNPQPPGKAFGYVQPHIIVNASPSSLPNDCSPRTPSTEGEHAKPIYCVVVKPPETVPVHPISNGDCESSDKTVSPEANRTENIPQVIKATFKGQLQANHTTNNNSDKDDVKVSVKCAPVEVPFSNNCEKGASKDTVVKTECLSEPAHRKVINSVPHSIKDPETATEMPLVEPQPEMEPDPAAIKDKRRASATEPVVILDKLTVADQVLAQKSVKQFIKTTLKEDTPPPSPVVERRRKVSKHKSRDKDKEKEKEKIVTKRKPPPPPPKKEPTNYRLFTSRKKAKEAEETTRKNMIVESEESEEEEVKNNKKKKPQQQGRRGQNKKQQSYAESPFSGEEGMLSESSSEDDDIALSALQEKKAKKKKERSKKVLDATEDLMDSNTYHNFSRTVEHIFDAMEEIDFTAELEEDSTGPAEALIPLFQLKDLCNNAAKMKMLKVMNQFPTERLVRLLTILERNVIEGAKLLPVQGNDEQDEDESKLWLELIMERVTRSADSSLTCLYIMTSHEMPEKVFLEDAIERIVTFVKFQLQNTVYPVFDPAYRVDPKSKDGYAGSIKQKRAHAHNKVKHKPIIQLYNKLHEIVGLLGELLELQSVTDTIILMVSSLGVSSFFVEGVSELQLSALRLVTSVFASYHKHRQLILEDILASIARLPTSKRSLRNYRLNSEENIQMLTALVLQLIHSVVRLPEPEQKNKITFSEKTVEKQNESMAKIDRDVLITTSYEAAIRTAVNFLSVFLKKCGTKNEEMDYRPLFENFVQDLLSTVNKPEWPASELLLSLLGRLLMQNFSNKSMDMTLRVASLDYLGVVAARLRKDAVSSQLKRETINEVIQQIINEISRSEQDQQVSPPKSKKSKHKPKAPKKGETQILQKALLNYLDHNLTSDSTLQFARRFYVAQWYRDVALEFKANKKVTSGSSKDPPESPPPAPPPIPPVPPSSSKKHKSRHRSRSTSSQMNCDVNHDEEVEVEPKKEVEEEISPFLASIEERKEFLLSVMQPGKDLLSNAKTEKSSMDYETAELVSRFLAARRPFSQSFDLYLSQILRVLNETSVAVRTKAMKCLTLVVEADPGILARADMQHGVHGRLLDQSTSVREAAVDLVGKFILVRPELTHKYYEMLTERILDTGVSVRKRVIKILKDVCLEQPDFPQIPEICVKIIRRVNDEEGIKKLVGEVFQSMWFTPVSDKKFERILQKVKNITHVVAACKDVGLEWFEQLLTNLLKNKEDANFKPVVKSCKQIVDCLVENVLQLEEASHENSASDHLVACFTTLFLFSKIQSHLVVPHATTIQPYLSLRSHSTGDYQVVQNVARILQRVVPMMEHPSESFLAQIEEDVVKLILRQGPNILPSCVSCLGVVINKVTLNFQLVRDCFQKFFVVLLGCKRELEALPDLPPSQEQRPRLLRSLFTVGLFCMHFDFSSIEPDPALQDTMRERVFDVIVYFTKRKEEEVRLKALTGLGFMLIRHHDFMMGKDVKDLYQTLLNDPTVMCNMKCQVLRNLHLYLSEEENRLILKDSEWSKVSKQEDLKEMDASSGMASTVIQVYLKPVLESVLNGEVHVRKAALQVIQLTLSQGLVHPVQIVPYLICLGSDNDNVLRTKADQLLQEIEKKYPGFVQMKAIQGVRMSFKLQVLLLGGKKTRLRGFREGDQPASRNGFLYTVIRATRQNRRAFLLTLLKLFDEQFRTSLQELVFLADNIVYFPYQVQDEPLFIMHQIDVMLSVSGSNLLQSFREGLLPRQRSSGEMLTLQQEQQLPQLQQVQPVVVTNVEEDDDDEDMESLLVRLPTDLSELHDCILASQGCVLMLFVKQTLKEIYGFTDSKIQQYSPNEAAKVYEKTLNRKSGVRFRPQYVLEFLEQEEQEMGDDGQQSREKLITHYLNFKQLMLTIDPNDDDDEDTAEGATKKSTASAPSVIAILNRSAEVKDEATEGGKEGTATPRAVKVGRPRTKHKQTPRATPKDKVKKKHKKKRRRILESDDSADDSDPDYE